MDGLDLGFASENHPSPYEISNPIPMNWHYVKDGEQYGPVTEEELKRLYESGQLSSNDLVWREGLSDWMTYGSTFEEPTASSPSESAKVSPEMQAAPQTDAIPARTGTGGQLPNSEIRARALSALSGNWWPAVGVVLAWFIIGQALMGIMGFIPLLGFFAIILCTGPLMLGLAEYFLRLSRGTDAQFSHLFNGFSNFVLGLVIYILMALIAVGAFLVAAIAGGIVMGISIAQSGGSPEANPFFWLGMVVLYIPVMIGSIFFYILFSLSYFIALDEPEMGAVHALKKSPAMVKGFKVKLFWMFLVFYGWSLLTLPTLGIGMLWVMPYMFTSLAGFHDDLKAPAEAAVASEPV